VPRGDGRPGQLPRAPARAPGGDSSAGGCARAVGVCLDTCHLFSAGYDLSTEAGTGVVMDEAVRRFGRRRIRCFHLNDSLRPRGARVDRHAEIGRGAMGLPAFRFLVNDGRFQGTPAVLETPNPGRYARGLRLLHSLIRK
jgi:deoxyribonuclease-4